MRRLFKFLFQLVMLVLLLAVLTGIWILIDGLNDLGGKAEVGLVMGTPESWGAKSDVALLDRAAKLYQDGDFPTIIVSGAPMRNGANEAKGMEKYLEKKGVPEGSMVIVEADNTPEAARKAADIIKDRDSKSVMLVTDYYHMTRTKLALMHEGVTSLEKAHVGILSQNDLWDIGGEIIALHTYVGKVYLLPLVEKVKEEAVTGAEKAKTDAEEAKEKVDKGIDKMPK